MILIIINSHLSEIFVLGLISMQLLFISVIIRKQKATDKVILGGNIRSSLGWFFFIAILFYISLYIYNRFYEDLLIIFEVTKVLVYALFLLLACLSLNILNMYFISFYAVIFLSIIVLLGVYAFLALLSTYCRYIARKLYNFFSIIFINTFDIIFIFFLILSIHFFIV